MAVGLSVVAGPPAQADCAVPSLASAAHRSDAVFVGSVTGMPAPNRFEVRASDVYRGSPGSFLTVVTGPSDPGAGVGEAVELHVDRQYLFFLIRDGRTWSAPGCLPTWPISSALIARADRVLGPATPLRAAPPAPSGSPPGSPVSAASGSAAAAPSSDDAGGSWWHWAGGAAALLAAAAGVAVAVRRRPR